MAIQYAPLFALETQFQTKDGRNNTGGWLKVFLAATDDPATTYSDYNGTRNPEKIVLDDDGRALVICDKSKAYRLEVYDINGMLLWTEEPVYCSGTGGGGVSITKVISTDGSIAIDESVAGFTTTYDIGLAPRDNDEFLEWIKCSEENCGSTWYPVFQDGTMETEAGQGIKVHKGQLYHFTNSFTVDPNGSGINYDTFRVSMYCGDDVVDERDFDIDSSLNDPVLCEFSRDVVPTEDTHVYFKLTIPSTCKVSGEVQCYRIYSGVNAVPDTCATKQWVSGSFQPLSGMSSYVPYSAVNHNTVGQVTGINGSSIEGSIDSATVSSIASSVASAYTESAFSSISSWTAEFSSISSKADQSALTAYQPVSAMSGYATEAYVDAAVGDKLDATASSLFLTSLPDDLATTGDVASAVSGKMDKAEGSAFYPMTGNPSGFLTAHQSLAGLATVEYVDSSVSSKLDTSAFASASAGFAPAGDYAFNSSLSSYIPASASGSFQPSGDYAFNSAVSSKLDASAMTSWIPYSALDYSGTAISGIGGSSLAGMGGGTGDYVEKSAMEVAIGSRSTALRTAFAQGNNCGASSNSFAQGSYNTVQSESFAQGSGNTATRDSLAQGYFNIAQGEGFAQGKMNKAGSYSFSQGCNNKANYGSFAQGLNNTAGGIGYDPNATEGYSFAQGIGNSAVYSAAVFGTYNLHGNGNTASGNSAAFAIGDGTANTARHDLMLVTKNGEITMYSSTADTVGLGLVSSIKEISAAATGGVDSATVSAIASAYTTGKQDTLAFAYNTADQISSINGSALAGQGGTTGDYYEKSSTELAYGTAASAARNSFSLGNASSDFCSIGIGDPTGFAGHDTIAKVCSISLGPNNAQRYSIALGRKISASGYSFAVGDTARAMSNSIAFGWATASGGSFAMGLQVSAINDAMVFGRYNLKGNGNVSTGHSAVFVIGDGKAANSRHDLMLVTRDGEITMFSSTADTVGTGIMSSIRAISAAATGGVDSATVSAIASSYATGKQDTLSFTYNAADQISSINGSALGGMDEAAVSGIVSAYAQSAASGKRTSAFNSGDFYSTSNPSGFITGVDLSPYQTTADMSGYIPTSMSSDFQPVTGMSSYVPYNSIGYNTANAISGINGLALAGTTYSAGTGIDITDDVISVEAPVDIVAGPGIVIDNPDGNTLRVSVDMEYSKVLYSAKSVISSSPGYVYPMAESILNFERIRVWFANREFTGYQCCNEFYPTPSNIMVGSMDASTSPENSQRLNMAFSANASGNLVDKFHNLWYGSYSNPKNASGPGRGLGILRVDGIHRTASN